MTIAGRAALTVRSGADAERLLTDSAARAEWATLMEHSASATVFQGDAFARAWWRTYGATHELASIQARGTDGRLAGQFMLVRGQGSEWEPIGRHQSEYPGVLAEGDDPTVIASMLQAAHRTLGAGSLRFRFLPPGTSTPGYIAGSRAAHIQERPRPLRRFADVGTASKRSKAKLNQLKRLGARVELLREPDAIARTLDEFMPLHDDRQAMQGYGTPFRDDPLKSRFLIALAEEGRLLHALTMRIDERLVAGILGVQNRSHVVLGLIAHAGDLEQLSPGASLIHEAGALYRNTDVDTLDLTPGDAYKERFATMADVTYAADLGWSMTDAVRITLRREVMPFVRRVRATLRRAASPGNTAKDSRETAPPSHAARAT